LHFVEDIQSSLEGLALPAVDSLKQLSLELSQSSIVSICYSHLRVFWVVDVFEVHILVVQIDLVLSGFLLPLR
jgi:hypothetical protein